MMMSGPEEHDAPLEWRAPSTRFQENRYCSRLPVEMNDKDSQRYRANLQGEVDGAAALPRPGRQRTDPKLAEVFRRLAAVEEAHAEFWRKPPGRPGRAPLSAVAACPPARLAGAPLRPGFVLPDPGRDRGARSPRLRRPARGAWPPACRPTSARMPASCRRDREPGRADRPELARARRPPSRRRRQRAARRGARRQRRAGLQSQPGHGRRRRGRRRTARMLLTGLAGLVAGACSMAMGEWLSVTSSRELNQKQIATEADELARGARRREGGAGPDLPGQGPRRGRRPARSPTSS